MDFLFYLFFVFLHKIADKLSEDRLVHDFHVKFLESLFVDFGELSLSKGATVDDWNVAEVFDLLDELVTGVGQLWNAVSFEVDALSLDLYLHNGNYLYYLSILRFNRCIKYHSLLSQA